MFIRSDKNLKIRNCLLYFLASVDCELTSSDPVFFTMPSIIIATRLKDSLRNMSIKEAFVGRFAIAFSYARH